MAYHRISDLSLDRKSWRIKVRVINVWKIPDASWAGFNCILIDEDQMSIEASASQHDTELFDSLLQEGIIYQLFGFSVIQRKKKYRSVPNELMIRLNRATSAVRISSENISIPLYKFTFSDFDQFQHLIRKDEDLLDVIGQIIGVGPLQGKLEQQRRTLEIQDLKKKQVFVTLWDKLAIAFDETAVLHRSDPVIVIFTGMTVRTWEGRICLSSSYSTRYYIGLDIPEVKAFSDGISEIVPVREITPRHNPPITSVVVADTVVTILDLLNLDSSKSQNDRFKCKATLVNIDPSEGWYYRACPNCKTTIQTYRSRIWCNRCSEADITPILWYKLNMIVEDHTGRASFIMFGKSVQDMIQIPVTSLAASTGSDRSILPPVFNKLFGKNYLFTVLIGRQSISASQKSFKVIAMTPDTDHLATPPDKTIKILGSTTASPSIIPTETPLSLSTSSATRRQLFLQANTSQTISDQDTNVTPSPASEVSTTTMPSEEIQLPNQADIEEPSQKRPRNLIVKKEKKD